MKFSRIDLETWPRAEVFRHFINDLRCVLTLTANVDVTQLVCACKRANYRFYPTFIYIVSKIVNNRTEFRLGFDEQGQVGLWDCVWPSYIVFNAQRESFTRLETRYHGDFEIFYAQAVADMKTAKTLQSVNATTKPAYTFDVSCLPWLAYTALDMHIFDAGLYLAPVITWGKFDEANCCLQMPLTLQIHHAAADGFHAARFYLDVEREIAALTSQI